MFQSSPGPKARSYQNIAQLPHHFHAVPILSRPEGPELPYDVTLGDSLLVVPILSRPEGPELREDPLKSQRLHPVPILSRPEGPELL